MATFYGTGVGGNYPSRMTIKTVATIVSQNAATNSSIINLKVYAYYNYTSYNTVNPTSGFQYIQIDKSEESTVYDFSSTQNFDYAGTSSTNTVKIMDWTSGSIAHNSDGTKTVNVKVFQDCPGVSTLDYMYDEFDWTLDTIPRASVPTLSASSVALGSSVTIYTNRVSTAFTHTINYTLGTTTAETQVTTGVTDSYAWTLPASLASALPSSTSGTLTFYVHTYSGAALIGTKTITMTVTIPNNSTYQPSVSLAIAEAKTAMAGAGFWLAGKSAIKATTTATGKYSATISSYAVSIDGVAYASAVSTGGVITTTGTKTVSVTVTDSRGFQSSASTTASFISLPAPTRSAASVDFGNAVTIYTNRPSTAVTSTLYYAIGTIGNTQISAEVGASYLWTVPKTAIGGFTNATSGTITVTQDFYNGAYYLGFTSVTLTGTIAKSIPTTNVSTVALGDAVTITTNRDHTTLTHTLKYTFGTTTTPTNIATAVGASHPWTTTSALANALTNAQSGTLTFTLETYNGTALIGSATKTITVTIPNNATYTPTVTAAIAEGTAAMIGAGAYISEHSSIKVTSTGTGKLGATISSYAVTINGSAYSGSVVTSSVIASSGNISVAVTVTDSRGYTVTYSTTVPFVAIAAPTFSLSTVALGSAITITTNRASTAITHTLKYAYGTQTGTVASEVGASHAWTLANSLASGLTSATSGPVMLTQESYFGARLLGIKTATFTATIPNIAAFRPVPTISSITEGATGLSAFTVFIQGKSKLTVASAATYQYGATLAKYDVTINGVAYIGTPVTSGVINAIGNVDITVKVTDSRGYSGTITTQRAFVAYNPPQLTAFNAVRDQEVNLSTPINYTVSPVSNQNSKSYLIEYRPTGGTWTTAHTDNTLYALDTTLAAASVLSNSSSYEVRVTLADSFVSVTKTVLIGTGFSLMDFRNTGKGIAFGKVSEKDAMEIAMAAEFSGGAYSSQLGALGFFAPLWSSGSGTALYVDGVDMNTVTKTGFYRGYNMTNGVSGVGISSFLVVQYSPDWITQIQISIEASPKMWARSYHTGTTWGEWKPLGGSALDAYPVGAIYLSATSTNPGTIFGGTWAAFGTGRTLVGIDTAQTEFNTVEKTGGHKNLQSHSHTGSSGSAGGHGHTASSEAGGVHSHTASSGAGGVHSHTASSGTTGAHAHTGTAAAGGGHGHTASETTTGAHTHTGTAASAGAHTHTIDYQRFSGMTTTTSADGFDLNRKAGTSSYGSSAAAQSAGAHTHTVSTVSAGGHAHTVTVAAAADHTHTVSTVSAGDHSHTVSVADSASHTHTVSVADSASHTHTVSVTSVADHSHTVTVGSTGAGNAENLQPYITVYMWKRTA